MATVLETRDIQYWAKDRWRQSGVAGATFELMERGTA
jgi:hypothetical protein